MVFDASSPLTRIGFRRDIKLFLSLLVTFFITVIVLLLFFLQGSVRHIEEAMAGEHNLIADVGAPQLRDVIASFGDATFESEMLSQRTRFGIVAIEVEMSDGRKRISGQPARYDETVQRKLPGGVVVYHFDGSTLHQIRTRTRMVAVITLAGTAAGTILLLLYLPQILRPIEAMLNDARQLGERASGTDEAAYLIDTFRNSIATLKAQEIELKRLNELERLRADDLQTITSTLTRSLTAGFIAVDANEQIVEVNASARDILDLAPDANAAGPIRTVVHDEQFALQLERALRTREPLNRLELELTGAGGTTKTVGLTAVPLFTPTERFLGTIALFTDLTVVRRLERRVNELQALADLGVMSAGIAHEFRNSLSTILGYLRLASRHEVSAEAAAKVMAAEKEAQELAEAVSGLLQFARPMTLQLGEVDLLEVLEEAVEKVRHTSPDVIFEVQGAPAIVAGDAALLARAFENLLRNSVEATAASDERRVSVFVESERHPVIRIVDSGCGVNEADASKLFLPFHTTKAHGVGMGLPLARKIILLHGGTITIANGRERGAVTTVELLDRPEAA